MGLTMKIEHSKGGVAFQDQDQGKEFGLDVKQDWKVRAP